MQTTAAKPVLWRCRRCEHRWMGWDRDTKWSHRPFCCLKCGTGEQDLELVIRQARMFITPAPELAELAEPVLTVREIGVSRLD